mgnify:CR=1 FL=1
MQTSQLIGRLNPVARVKGFLLRDLRRGVGLFDGLQGWRVVLALDDAACMGRGFFFVDNGVYSFLPVPLVGGPLRLDGQAQKQDAVSFIRGRLTSGLDVLFAFDFDLAFLRDAVFAGGELRSQVCIVGQDKFDRLFVAVVVNGLE